MATLWSNTSTMEWRTALELYEDVIARQGATRLPALDRWYREELPDLIANRPRPHVTAPELVKLTEWKMARGVWRARNLVLVKGNAPDEVKETSGAALARVPHPTDPISRLSKLAGVGPATASAVAAAAAPTIYPFLDELVAAQITGLGKPAFTLGYYARYATAIRDRAERLGDDWTPVMVERALWAHVGGKTGLS